MDNTKVQEFLNLLTEEQRTALLACKTEEELDNVIDEYDIDIPDEMLVGVAGGKGFLPMLMAGIMAFSSAGAAIAATSPVQASAESIIEVSLPELSGSEEVNYVADWSQEKDSIEDFFRALDYDQENFFNFVLEDDITSQSKTVKNADGSISIIQRKRKDDIETYDSFAVSNADANTIYPGALLKANQGLVTGNPTPISVPRRELHITIPGAYMKDGCDSMVLVNPTDGSAVNNAINKLRSNFKENTDMPAQMTARIEKVESEEQIKAKMNFSEEFWGKIKLSASADYQTQTQAVIVDISQVFYSVSADNVTDADLFPDTMTASRLSRYINAKEPPVVVSNVDYGKRIIACIQTDDMSFDLKASVEAEAYGGGIKGGAEAEYRRKLANCSVKVFAMGGSSRAAGEYLTMSVDDLMKAARNNTAFDGYAVPVSYTTRWAKDGSIAQTNYSGYTWETKEVGKLTEAIPIRFEFSQYYKQTGSPKGKAIVKIYGRRVVGINNDGSMIRGEDELIKTATLDYSTVDNFVLPGDVIAETLKFDCSYVDENGKEVKTPDALSINDMVSGVNRIYSENFTVHDIKLIKIYIGSYGVDGSVYKTDFGLSFKHPGKYTDSYGAFNCNLS